MTMKVQLLKTAGGSGRSMKATRRAADHRPVLLRPAEHRHGEGAGGLRLGDGDGQCQHLAVATLADVSCVVMAEGVELDETARARAKEQGVTVLATEEPVFEAALNIYRELESAGA